MFENSYNLKFGKESGKLPKIKAIIIGTKLFDLYIMAGIKHVAQYY